MPPNVTFSKHTFVFIDVNRAKWVDVIFTAEETLEFNGTVEFWR